MEIKELGEEILRKIPKKKKEIREYLAKGDYFGLTKFLLNESARQIGLPPSKMVEESERCVMTLDLAIRLFNLVNKPEK